MSAPKPVTPIAEEALDKLAELLEGPVNTNVEKLMKSSLVLAPVGLFLNVTCRSIRFAQSQGWLPLLYSDGGKK